MAKRLISSALIVGAANGAQLDISDFSRSEFTLSGGFSGAAGSYTIEVAVDEAATVWAPLYHDNDALLSFSDALLAKYFRLLGRKMRVGYIGAPAGCFYSLFH